MPSSHASASASASASPSAHRSLILVYSGFPSAAAAALLLRSPDWSGAQIQIASKAGLPAQLAKLKPKAWEKIAVMGVGFGGTALEGRTLFEELSGRGLQVLYYVSGYSIPWLKALRLPGLEYREVTARSWGRDLVQWTGVRADSETEEMGKMIADYDLKNPGESSEAAAWVTAQFQQGRRQGDQGKRYLDSIRTLARTIELAPHAKRQAERFRMIGEWDLAGEKSPLKELRTYCQRIGSDPGGCRVLILGESGTGKELVARFMHESSTRESREFRALNCATFSGSLADSELFGHCKGAFTGASTERAGAFELANRGTLFLDEVGELSLEVQAKLLRVLQTGVVTRLGEETERKVDVRIFSATNRDLHQMVADGSFREDLFYRLAEVKLETPPLRDIDGEDFDLIVGKHLWRINQDRDTNWWPSEEDWEALYGYDWPGNVRQLRNVLLQAVVTQRSVEELLAEEPERAGARADAGTKAGAGSGVGGSRPGTGAGLLNRKGKLLTTQEVLVRHCTAALEHMEGNRTATATALGISYNTLVKYLE
jgi:transcriptional regulator with PAS, ATPase and Fis domain